MIWYDTFWDGLATNATKRMKDNVSLLTLIRKLWIIWRTSSIIQSVQSLVIMIPQWLTAQVLVYLLKFNNAVSAIAAAVPPIVHVKLSMWS